MSATSDAKQCGRMSFGHFDTYLELMEPRQVAPPKIAVLGCISSEH